MPNFPIVDSHVHLWDPHNARMTWIDGHPILDQRYLPEEFALHRSGVDVEAFVYVETGVEPHFAYYEARWAALELAAREPKLKAIVAAAPLEYGARVRSYLKALVDISPLIKGVRRITQGESDPAFCLKPEFVAGAQLLSDFGLSCDLCINYKQLAPSIELVKLCPQTQFIIDHIAKPNIVGNVLDPWREQMTVLAAQPNVVCKISGVVTEADHSNWTVAGVRPYIEHALHVLGEDRVLFGSDWPVLLLASNYERWVTTMDTIMQNHTSAAKLKLFRDNGRRIYRMG